VSTLPATHQSGTASSDYDQPDIESAVRLTQSLEKRLECSRCFESRTIDEQRGRARDTALTRRVSRLLHICGVLARFEAAAETTLVQPEARGHLFKSGYGEVSDIVLLHLYLEKAIVIRPEMFLVCRAFRRFSGPYGFLSEEREVSIHKTHATLWD
jgi:hypothetical protein